MFNVFHALSSPKVSKENVKSGFHYNVFIPSQCAHGSRNYASTP